MLHEVLRRIGVTQRDDTEQPVIPPEEQDNLKVAKRRAARLQRLAVLRLKTQVAVIARRDVND